MTSYEAPPAPSNNKKKRKKNKQKKNKAKDPLEDLVEEEEAKVEEVPVKRFEVIRSVAPEKKPDNKQKGGK